MQPDTTLELVTEILNQNIKIIRDIVAKSNTEEYIKSDIYKSLCRIEKILLIFLYQIVPKYPQLEKQVGDNLVIIYHNRVKFPWN